MDQAITVAQPAPSSSKVKDSEELERRNTQTSKRAPSGLTFRARKVDQHNYSIHAASLWSVPTLFARMLAQSRWRMQAANWKAHAARLRISPLLLDTPSTEG